MILTRDLARSNEKDAYPGARTRYIQNNAWVYDSGRRKEKIISRPRCGTRKLTEKIIH